MDDRQRPDSMRRRSSDREPSTHAPEQPRGSAAQRAQREMAPMVTDIEKLLSSVSLQTIRKCVTRHFLLSLMLIQASFSNCSCMSGHQSNRSVPLLSCAVLSLSDAYQRCSIL